MFIKELQPRQTKVDVEGEVVEITDVREFSKFGKQGKVATAILKDASGQVKLSLWNEQTEQVKAGDVVKITNGYVNEFQGEMQLTTGKFGTLEVVPKEEGSPEHDLTPDNEEEASLEELKTPHDGEDAVTEDSKLMAEIDDDRPKKKPVREDTETAVSEEVEEEDFS